MSILKFLQENGIALCSLVVAVVAFRWTLRKEKRQLRCSVNSTLLFGLSDFGESALSLSYQERRIAGLWCHEVILKNVGNRDLTLADHAEPFKIDLETPPLSVKLQGGVDSSFVEVTGSGAVLRPPLLKSGEGLSVVLLTETEDKPKLTTRFTDFKILDDSPSDGTGRSMSWLKENGVFLTFVALLVAIQLAAAAYFSKTTSAVSQPKTADIMWEIDSIRTLTVWYAKDRNHGLMPNFDTAKPPGWAKNEEAILRWGGLGSYSQTITKLADWGVQVTTAPEARGKLLKELSPKTPVLVIKDSRSKFPYSSMTYDGQFQE